MLDVRVTQHARWTARRIRRALFGQSLIDFSGDSWSAIKTHERSSSSQPEIVNRRKKKVSRMAQEFSLVPGMSQYRDSQDVDMDAGSVVDSANGRSFSTSAVNFEIAGSVSLSRPAARDAGVSIAQSMTQGAQFFELSP